MPPHSTPRPGEITALLHDLARIPAADGGEQWGPSLAPGVRIGRFELVRELGRGSFGLVFEARDVELGRSVAFKVLRPGRADVGADQLRREAEIVARLTHPNLVTLHDVGSCEHGPYLVLELLEGLTLSRRLEQGPLSTGEAVQVATEVARGLAHAHARGVVHRDLKPSNVFLCHGGGVKVLDFGLAHALGRRRLEGGSPDYMAPEQWRGAPEDERTDVFALGVLLYRMLTGQRPFPSDGGETVSGPHPAPVVEVPELPGLGELLARMLAKDPVERPRDGKRTLEALLALRADPGAASASGSTVRVRRVRRRRLGWGLAAVVAILLAAAAAGVALQWRTPAGPGLPSVAVLPFADMSPAHDQEFFSDGLTEEVIDALAHVDGLRVTGRTSSFAFKGKNEDLRSIGRRLEVGAVLEGSVRREGTRVRVTAQLVKTTDGYHLWSQTYEREVTGIFAVQDEIALAVVDALKVKLLSGQQPISDHRTSDAEVFRDYLLGRQAARSDTEKGMLEAVHDFERALVRAPDYAPAWAGLSVAVFWVFGNQGHTQDDILAGQERARAAADKAVSLGPDLADGYAARGFLRIAIDRDWAGAEADMRRALELNPGASDIHWRYARDLLGPLGRFDEAIASVRRATDLDPLSASAWSTLSALYLGKDQLGSARAAALRSLELRPVQDSAPTFVASVDLLEGKPQHAMEVVQSCPDLLYRQQYEAMALHDLGREGESEAVLATMIGTRAQDAAFQIATVYAWRGDASAAFQWLERALAQHDGGLMDLRMEPLLRKLRGDPRLASLQRRLGLPEK